MTRLDALRRDVAMAVGHRRRGPDRRRCGVVVRAGKVAATTTFEATHTLILSPQAVGNSAIAGLRRWPRWVRSRSVSRPPLRMDPRVVRSRVSAKVPIDSARLDLLLVTARSADPTEAEALANVTAEELIAELGRGTALSTLEPAIASPADTAEIRGPRSRPGRALLLGAFGLFSGVGGAFAVERLTIGFGRNLLPRRPERSGCGRGAGDRPVGARTCCSPAAVNAGHRGLSWVRTGVVQWSTQSPDEARATAVIIVTSPTGGEGTTTTVAHLAAMLGEIGRSVVVISADLRRPTCISTSTNPATPASPMSFGGPRMPGVWPISIWSPLCGESGSCRRGRPSATPLRSWTASGTTCAKPGYG